MCIILIDFIYYRHSNIFLELQENWTTIQQYFPPFFCAMLFYPVLVYLIKIIQ